MTTRSLLMHWMIVSLIGYSLSSHAQLPVEPTVIHGNAIIDTVGTHMTVINSPNTILNWQSFSIGSNHSVFFQQPNADSALLNRVTGHDPSHIFGNLGSNGHIWLINPYGVFFSENARIDAAGLTVSTLDISNIDFLAKRYYFNSTGTTGEIRNQGDIRTSFGGRVWLLGDQVRNEGLVQTSTGEMVLAAGKSIELVDSGAPNLLVRVTAPENEVVNLGSLVAANGTVDLHGKIVNQEGIVRANSVGTDDAGNIVLKAETITLAVNSRTQADNGSVQLIAQTALDNRGVVTANDVYLAANNVLQQGEIKATGGGIDLIANAATYLDGLMDVSSQQGSGGDIRISTARFEGTADGVLRVDGEEGGAIRINAKDTFASSSALIAIGEKQGGVIEVAGDKVILLNANVDASGKEQGGTVYLGRDQRNGDSSMHTQEVVIGAGTEVNTNGGEIILSSSGKVLKTADKLDGFTDAVLFDSEKLILTSNPVDNLQLAGKIFSGSVSGEPRLEVGDNFGGSVAFQGNLLAVGAPGHGVDGNDQGAVYLFSGAGNDTSGLTLKGKLSSQTGAVNMPVLGGSDFFGSALAIDGDRLVVGVKGELLSEGNPGAVHLFTGVGSDFSGLTWQKVLSSDSGAVNMPDLKEFDFFGTALALDGDRLLVGAAGDSSGGPNRGAVHMFTGVGSDFSGLAWQGKLTSGVKGIELADSDFFGWSLALDGDKMAIGAFNDNAGGSHRGSVHLFSDVGTDFTNLVWQGKLTSGKAGLTLANSDFFGWSVALHGDRMAVGALGDDAGGKDRGAVYMFASVGSDFSGLQLENKIAPDIKSDAGGFGLSLALRDERLMVGSADSSDGRGALYLLNWLPQRPLTAPPASQATVDTSIQSVNAAATGARAVLDAATDGRVLNIATETTSSGFGRLNLAQMSIIDMQQLIDYRREFKRNLFSDAIYKLELDPTLSDIPYCLTFDDIHAGTCRISDKQLDELKASQEKEQQLVHQSRHKAKIAVLPQIERKFVVLFGVDQYLDKSIPALENTISDAQAVGRLFAEKLGYEVRVVKNATKAEIVQTLNQLSLEMEKNDSVVIYYAGHGFINEKTGNGYWIPSDASAKDPASWISNTSVSEMLANIRAKQMVMISDSCYSGAFTKEDRVVMSDGNIKPEDILVKRSVVVMSSGGDEPVADEGREGHSIFAWFLMQAIQNVDNWKAGANVFEQVQRDVSKSFPQTPQYGAATAAGHEKGGDYLFEYRQLE